MNCIYDTGTGGNLKSQRIRKPLKKQSEQKGQKRLEEYSQKNRTRIKETVKGEKGKNQINLGSHPTNMSPLRKENREGRILKQ